MRTRRLTSLVIAGALAACAEAPTTPTPIASSAHAIGSLLDPDGHGVAASVVVGPVTIHVTGAAHRAFDDRPIILNVNARSRADGGADGHYYFRQVFNGLWIRVGVTCVSTRADNEAWVAGVIEDSSSPGLIGTVSYFYTFDNGEGGASTDVVSLTAGGEPEGEDAVFCADQPEILPQREVLHGEISVEVR